MTGDHDTTAPAIYRAEVPALFADGVIARRNPAIRYDN